MKKEAIPCEITRSIISTIAFAIPFLKEIRLLDNCLIKESYWPLVFPAVRFVNCSFVISIAFIEATIFWHLKIIKIMNVANITSSAISTI